jgi:hypothetical protein
MLRMAQRASRSLVMNHQQNVAFKPVTPGASTSLLQRRFFATPPSAPAAAENSVSSQATASPYDPMPLNKTGPGLQDVTGNNNVGNQVKKFLGILILNPFTLGYGLIMYSHLDTKLAGEEDERNALQASPFIAQTRQARRDSLSAFKEHVWQTEDPKKEYDANTWARFNYTTVVKSNSFRPGGEEASFQKKDSFKRKNSKTGLYDSDGLSGDSTRASSGIAAYRAQAHEENNNARLERGEAVHAK